MTEFLSHLVSQGGVVVLSGAGLSTESGIPDYRGPTGTARRATPMTYQAFLGSPQARQRYWARSHLGWKFVEQAQPNRGHRAVAHLQDLGLVTGVITQNVDGLHQAADTRDVVELHGALNQVVCLQCGDLSPRPSLAARLHEANPTFAPEVVIAKPDGDVDLEVVSGFRVVDCLRCGGLLKPDVVFFGETVPKDHVDRSFALVDSASALLVLGSSLKVMSGYRFVLRASKLEIPVVIINQGSTRGDALATLCLDASLGSTLMSLAEGLKATTDA